ncbi:MAG: hypothetical protein WBD83_11570, partial [Xanthobacteraceae bacterium]
MPHFYIVRAAIYAARSIFSARSNISIPKLSGTIRGASKNWGAETAQLWPRLEEANMIKQTLALTAATVV